MKHARTFSPQPEKHANDSNGYHRTRTIVGPALMPSVSRGKHCISMTIIVHIRSVE